MTIDEFWRLIDLIDRVALTTDPEHPGVARAPLVTALAALERPEVQAFQNHLAQALFDIDGDIFAVPGVGSDDGFLHLRCFIVAMGRSVYKASRHDPARVKNHLDGNFETLLYAASDAWEQKSGERTWFKTAVSYESGSNTALWPSP